MGRWKFMGVILIVLFVSLGSYQRGWTEERYVVKPGDTLSAISKSFGVSIGTLKKTNGLVKDTIRDGQILVIHDLVGSYPWFTPKHVKPRLNAAELMRRAVAEWRTSL